MIKANKIQGGKTQKIMLLRKRRVFLSGAQFSKLYPLRYCLHQKRRWNLCTAYSAHSRATGQHQAPTAHGARIASVIP